MRRTAFILSAILGIATMTARADDRFYLGTWTFDSAAVAPWATPHQKPDEKEKNALLGKTVTLAPAAITGPQVFACKGPHYKVSEFSADLLFQGAFADMHDNDKSADPVKLAASLGFNGTSFKTLETGCEIDWHFINPTTVEVGLNDYVYTLKKR